MSILILLTLLHISLQTTLPSPQTTLYFSLPFHTLLNHSRAHHLVPIEVNRYPYVIDFTLSNAKDHILSV